MRKSHLMIALAAKYLLRHRTRSLLTLLGVAVGIFIFATIETLQHAIRESTEQTANDTTLVVYRENRFCPATSRLPEHYVEAIRRIDGVVEAIPVQVTVNNCGASLDVIAFRGVPGENLLRYNPDITIVSGSHEDWLNRSDGALVGAHFAARRGLQPGDTFEAVGVRVVVSGILQSPHPQDINVAYVHLPFLQQASRVGLGTVTQFNVRVREAALLGPVAEKIDAYFKSESDPTTTRPEKAFVAQTAKDMMEMVGFARWLGLAAVLGVMGLVANALLLAARSRVREGAVLQTIGFSRKRIAVLMLLEGAMLGLAGGALGSICAAVFLSLRRLSFGNEGVTLALTPNTAVTLSGVAVALVVALIASIWPAVVSARAPIIASLRTQ